MHKYLNTKKVAAHNRINILVVQDIYRKHLKAKPIRGVYVSLNALKFSIKVFTTDFFL